MEELGRGVEAPVFTLKSEGVTLFCVGKMLEFVCVTVASIGWERVVLLNGEERSEGSSRLCVPLGWRQMMRQGEGTKVAREGRVNEKKK